MGGQDLKPAPKASGVCTALTCVDTDQPPHGLPVAFP